MNVTFKDPLFQAQWLRAASHASAGGADIGECLAATRQIGEPDPTSWFDAGTAWLQNLLAAAETSHAAGRRISALDSYLRASNYFRTAYTFLIGAPVDPRVLDGYRHQRDAFTSAASLMDPSAQPIAIPYGDATLHGYLFRAADDGVPRPTLIITGGYDSTAEELYFFSGAAAVARGFTCLVFDGPGQGSSIIEKGLVFRPDWEAVVGPVIDYAVTLPGVDPAGIALMGISFGGYLAPRAASSEPRLAACIADPANTPCSRNSKAACPLSSRANFPTAKASPSAYSNRSCAAAYVIRPQDGACAVASGSTASRLPSTTSA